MERTIWLCIMLPIAGLFTGLGVYARRREKPMWFNSGRPVEAREITDVPAYNRANGRMWIAFSLVYWVGAALGFFSSAAAGVVVGVGTIAGIPVLYAVYRKIYARYKR